MRQLISCVLAATLATASSGDGKAADLHFPGAGAAAVAELPPLPELAAGTVDLGALRDRALALAEQFPAVDYDVEPLAAYFAGDPAAAFAYVQQLLVDPYPGVLRGPAGVLGARAGSPADKAALLVDLLRAMGIEARFAFGTLDEDHRQQLRAFAMMPYYRNPAMNEVGTLAGLSAAGTERLAARARRDFAWLWAAVGDRLAPPAVAEIQPSPRHVWVQAMIDGAWVDLDPQPYRKIGETMAALGATADALPEQMFHTVRLALVAESVGEGGVATATVLDRTLTAAAAADARIFLSFGPAGSAGASPVRSARARSISRCSPSATRWCRGSRSRRCRRRVKGATARAEADCSATRRRRCSARRLGRS
jgi:transglutaminase-like putative cysteine protease